MFSSPAASAQDRSFLTSVSSSSQTFGTLGDTLANPQSTVSRSSPTSTSSLSFSPRILSLSPPVEAQDDAFAFKPVIDELHTETNPKTFIEIPRSSLPPKVSEVPRQSFSNNVIDVDVDKDGVEISSLIPAIISAVNDDSTTPREKSSLMSLLSDMVGHVQDQQDNSQRQSQRQQKQSSDAASGRRIQGSA